MLITTVLLEARQERDELVELLGALRRGGSPDGDPHHRVELLRIDVHLRPGGPRRAQGKKDEKLEKEEFEAELKEVKTSSGEIGSLVDAWCDGRIAEVARLMTGWQEGRVDQTEAARRLLQLLAEGR